MLVFLIFIMALLVLIGAIRMVLYPVCLYDEDDELVSPTTTTTTTTVVEEAAVIPEQEPEFIIKGDIKRQKDGDQYFVIDPADGKKVWINEDNDLYRDNDDIIWQVVD